MTIYKLSASEQQIFTQELNTIRDILRWLTSTFQKANLFFGHGTDNAWDEVISLLKFYFKLNEKEFEICLDAKVSQAEFLELWDLVLQRVNLRKPLPYIIKSANFANLEFYVDERVLIPRSPFAELIQNNFEPAISGEQNFNKVLELGTGSGCIAAAIASYYPDLEVWAVDNSDDALAVAQINLENLDLTSQVNLIKSDWFTELKKLKQNNFDIIIANPPYVDLEIYENLPAEYKHEPRQALYSAAAGLADPIKILAEAADFLSKDGYLFLEVGVARTALENYFPKIPFLWLDFVHGGEGILMFTADELRRYQEIFKNNKI